eukprot:scaffold87029_cov26-Tisochrysis_lutea.AAC.3
MSSARDMASFALALACDETPEAAVSPLEGVSVAPSREALPSPSSSIMSPSKPLLNGASPQLQPASQPRPAGPRERQQPRPREHGEFHRERRGSPPPVRDAPLPPLQLQLLTLPPPGLLWPPRWRGGVRRFAPQGAFPSRALGPRSWLQQPPPPLPLRRPLPQLPLPQPP